MADKKPPLGTGQRFAALKKKLADARNPAGLAAWIGRRKWTKRRFQKMAAAGKKG